jgi:hypothetical protein
MSTMELAKTLTLVRKEKKIALPFPCQMTEVL